MRVAKPYSRILTALTALLAFALAGCGGGWTSVPVSDLSEASETLGGDIAEFTLNDDRVFEMRVVTFEYPYVEGHRIVSEWMTPAKMRIDLREVAKIKVKSSAS